jgi:hypothetical protein
MCHHQKLSASPRRLGRRRSAHSAKGVGLVRFTVTIETAAQICMTCGLSTDRTARATAAPASMPTVTPKMMSAVFAISVNNTDPEHEHLCDHRIAAEELNKLLAQPVSPPATERVNPGFRWQVPPPERGPERSKMRRSEVRPPRHAAPRNQSIVTITQGIGPMVPGFHDHG